MGCVAEDGTRVSVNNMAHFSRVSVVSELASLAFDYVPAPSAWELSDEEKPEFAHFNLKVNKVSITSQVNGVMGASARLKFDDNGKPIMKAYDKDGKGVLDMPVEGYEIPALLAKFPLYTNA